MSPETAAAAIAGAATVIVTFLSMRRGAKAGAAEGAGESVWEVAQGLLDAMSNQMDKQDRRIGALEDEVCQMREDLILEREVGRGLRRTVDRLERLIARLRIAITALEQQVLGLGQTPVTQVAGGGVELEDDDEL